MANTSHHLRSLAGAGLLRSRREGTRIIYALAGAEVGELWASVRGVAAAHVAEVEHLAEAYLGERDGLELVSRDELAARLAAGDVTVIDVRPAPEYAAAHIAGATSIPISELERRLELLPRDASVVAYCRGPFCVYADDAVRLLRARGFDARRLEDGYPEWNRAGLPVAVGDGRTA
jgi:rhodanese-related sulfurtransferase